LAVHPLSARRIDAVLVTERDRVPEAAAVDKSILNGPCAGAANADL
jgi:hypothetical protein